MREILFRGKRIDNREWAEGYLYGIGEKKYILYELPNSAPTIGIEVDPETICQYTGLTNKKGQKIWEGDVLEAHLDELYPENITRERVMWDQSGFVTSEPILVEKDYLDDFDLEHFAVIGNMFDNPNLMEEYWNGEIN